VRTSGRSDGGRLGGPGTRFLRVLIGRPLLLFATVGLCLALTPGVASAATNFTWTGHTLATEPEDEEWSEGSNWEGDTAPNEKEALGTLTFPRLNRAACTSKPPTESCYFSFNDLEGVSDESMSIDDGDDYFLEGETLKLGKGGLTATPESPSGAAGDFFFMPLELGAAQKWEIANRSGGKVEENGILLGEELTGSKALTIELSKGAALVLEDETEVGPLKIEGPNAAGERIENGSVFLQNEELNAFDDQPVDLTHVFFAGTGEVGPLSTNGATLDVGTGTKPAGLLEAASVTLDAASGAVFEIRGSGATAQNDYSQLTSEGPVALAGAIAFLAGPPKAKEACPVLPRGQTYTFISTSAPLTGSFANAPEGGAEIPIDFVEGCPAQTIRISYHRSGATKTVTGTVEEAAVKRAEEEAAGKQGSLPSAAAPAAAVPQLKEVVKVLDVKEGSPDATIAGRTLQESSSGAVALKISCPAGVTSCTGTATLRTLSAVSARVSHAARRKSVLTLGVGSFTVPGGKVKTITLHLPAKARALLAHLHLLRARATILAHDPAGGVHAGQEIVTLHAPKPKHGKG
jgi:hypothetical protein